MLTADARAEITRQIEEMRPSSALLEAKGVDWETAATLARFIKTGEPDVTALRDHGLPLVQSVEICETISKRLARKAVALAAMKTMAETLPKPVSTPAPKPAEPAADELHGMTALSMAHTLCEMAVSRQAACLTTLINEGWSKSTAIELVKVFNAARTAR